MFEDKEYEFRLWEVKPLPIPWKNFLKLLPLTIRDSWPFILLAHNVRVDQERPTGEAAVHGHVGLRQLCQCGHQGCRGDAGHATSKQADYERLAAPDHSMRARGQ